MMKNPVPILACLLLFLIAGCGSDSGYDESTAFTNPTGAVQFVNMVSDSPQLSVIHGLNSTVVSFGFASPLVVRVVDEYDWRVAYVDELNREVTIAEGKDALLPKENASTFLIMGDTNQTNVQIVNYPLTPVEDRPAGQTEVWFAASSTRFSMFDVYVTAADADISSSQPTSTVSSASFTAIVTIEAGENKRIRITEAAGSTVLFDSGTISFPDQIRELFAIVDSFEVNGENHVDLIRTATDTGGSLVNTIVSPAVKLANFSSVTPLEIQLGSILASGLAHSDAVAYADIANGTHPLSVRDESGTELLSAEVPLTIGIYQSLLMFDSTDNVVASIVTADDLRYVTSRSNVQFVNGSEQFVDFYFLRDGNSVSDTPPAVDNLGFAPSGSAETRPGVVTVSVTNANDTTVLSSVTATLEEGKSYTAIFDKELHLITLTAP